MAHGCVIVASNGASLDELINDGESGFLFKLGDAIHWRKNLCMPGIAERGRKK